MSVTSRSSVRGGVGNINEAPWIRCAIRSKARDKRSRSPLFEQIVLRVSPMTARSRLSWFNTKVWRQGVMSFAPWVVACALWRDESADKMPIAAAIVATGLKRLLISGLLTEACVSFGALSARERLRSLRRWRRLRRRHAGQSRSCASSHAGGGRSHDKLDTGSARASTRLNRERNLRRSQSHRGIEWGRLRHRPRLLKEHDSSGRIGQFTVFR
jgi:hypothetical protein